MNMRFFKLRLLAMVLVAGAFLLGFFVYSSQVNQESQFRFKTGLDLSGGSYLVYRADVSGVSDSDVKDSMASLRDVLERRINLFGVVEPSVSTETASISAATEHRLVIELPGITDIEEAIETIGQTPLLEFKIENPDFDRDSSSAAISAFLENGDESLLQDIDLGEPYVATDLTGRFLKRATLQFQSGGGYAGSLGSPVVALEFDKEGSDLFADITREHVGETVAIFLDGSPISTPVVQQEIVGGEAVITGNFTPDEAKQLVGRLNSGALPIPIELISTETIGPSLGFDAVSSGVRSGVIGFLLVALFLILWYRLPGLLAVLSLGAYGVIMMALFKFIPVTLTAAGLAGFVISLGIAVDANILIFERVKEEIREGRTIRDAIREGFTRAWPSIRDANISSLISAVILFWFGSSLIQGFALVFGLGVFVSMLSAITLTRVFLYACSSAHDSPMSRFLFGSGFRFSRNRVS